MAVVTKDTSSPDERQLKHGIVIPLYGECPPDLAERVSSYNHNGMVVLLVQNNQGVYSKLPHELKELISQDSKVRMLFNHNLGGVAGGFNRGIEAAIHLGMEWITLLDQDSRLSAKDVGKLLEPWESMGNQRLLVGPMIWDKRRKYVHGHKNANRRSDYIPTRLLISSGTTFRTADWEALGPMDEWLIVDFVDHLWSFKAQARGFKLIQHPNVILHQSFGEKHPNPLCHLIGLQLYPPMRHYYSLRNLRYLSREPSVPIDLKLKEVVKMLLKPWLWLLFEPERSENLRAIVQALRTPIPIDVQKNGFRG
jgi:rhamnosyltransferase